MRILIFGLSSYIGKNLAKILSLQNEIWGTVGKNSSGIVNANEVPVDFFDSNWINKLPNLNFDVAIWAAQSREYSQDLSDYPAIFKINCTAFQEAIDFCYKMRVSHFIFLSSGTVYKKQNLEVPYCEHDPIDHHSYYGFSKYISEKVAEHYAHDGMKVSCLRLFSVYGPYQLEKVIPRLIGRIISGQDIMLNAGLGMIFSPIYIDDLIKIICAVIDKPPAELFSIMNVAGKECVSLKEICDHVAELSRKKVSYKDTLGEYSYSVANTSSLNNRYPLCDFTSIKKGLFETIRALDLAGQDNDQ